MYKGVAEKKINAVPIKRRATVSDPWSADRLIMGHVSRVAKCSRIFNSDPALPNRYVDLEAKLKIAS